MDESLFYHYARYHFPSKPKPTVHRTAIYLCNTCGFREGHSGEEVRLPQFNHSAQSFRLHV